MATSTSVGAETAKLMTTFSPSFMALGAAVKLTSAAQAVQPAVSSARSAPEAACLADVSTIAQAPYPSRRRITCLL
jgi:hypothetical protein